MPRQLHYYSIFIGIFVGDLVILYLFKTEFIEETIYRPFFTYYQKTEVHEDILPQQQHAGAEPYDYSLNIDKNFPNTQSQIKRDIWNIENILTETRAKIKHELRNYNFSHSGVDKLDDLLMESGGKPVTSMLVSTWRSGSSFLGELLNAMPSNFYNYEPLSLFGVKQIRGPPLAQNATRLMRRMLKCNYYGADAYFNLCKKYMKLFQFNPRLWYQCKNKTELCLDANFLSKFCKLFPFQSMKLVRFRLHLVEKIMEDEKLNVKVVLLIRDPRAVMQSRFERFCSKVPDCASAKSVCADMVSDHEAAGSLLKKYPDRFIVIRFEDLVLSLNETTHRLLKFLGLGYTPSIEEFLQMHTNVETEGPFSTYRISKNVPFKWKNILDFSDVTKIQNVCKAAMKLWGYQLAHNASHMDSNHFYPLLSYSVIRNK